jgi:phosphoribosylglycinamide formyltransferase 2
MSVSIGTPFQQSAKKVMLCGSGELGKEVVIELQRYGVEVIALDAYANAPAMQVADRFHVVSMLDGDALREIILEEKPDLVVPEVEAIATDVLAELEKAGEVTIIPTARATQLTMNREGIRRLAAEELGLKTSPYQFAETEEDFKQACFGNRNTLCGQADYELIGEGPEHDQERRGYSTCLGVCTSRRPGRAG